MTLGSLQKRVQRLEARGAGRAGHPFPEGAYDLAAEPWKTARNYQERRWALQYGVEQLLGYRFPRAGDPTFSIGLLTEEELDQALLAYSCLGVALELNALPGFGVSIEQFMERVDQRLTAPPDAPAPPSGEPIS
jgi:hypothetical protein